MIATPHLGNKSSTFLHNSGGNDMALRRACNTLGACKLVAEVSREDRAPRIMWARGECSLPLFDVKHVKAKRSCAPITLAVDASPSK